MPQSAARGRARVLHIRRSPLSRTRREGLLAIGVEVESLTPDDLSEALRDAARRDEMTQRVAEAPVCVIDEGVGIRLGACVLSLRHSTGGRTLTTIDSIYEMSEGMAMSHGSPPHLPPPCQFVIRTELFRTLRDLAPTPQAEAPVAVDGGEFTRPPRPITYVKDPNTFTSQQRSPLEATVSSGVAFWSGATHVREMLAPGALAQWSAVDAESALTHLVCHLPSEELWRMASEEARGWWDILARRLVWGERGPPSVFWHAIARDGGRETLAALPEALFPWRDDVQARWPHIVREVTEVTPLELVDAGASTRYALSSSMGASAARYWDVVPCEDPLAPDADPNLFQPTLTALRAARRYRPAPEVILGAHARWGGRPFQEAVAARGLKRFVEGAFPSSAEELDGWVRVLRTLPPGRALDAIRDGMGQWPRLELDLVEAWGDTWPPIILLPCFDRAGNVIPELVQRIPQPALRGAFESLGLSLAPAPPTRTLCR